MSEPIKVNAYYIVSSFGTKNESWRVLGDGESIIITKPENTVEIDRENHRYSVLYWKDAITHSFAVKETEMILMTDFGITLYEKKDKNDSNKQNVAKI